MQRHLWALRLASLVLIISLTACGSDGDGDSDGGGGDDNNASSNNASSNSEPNNSACALDCRPQEPSCEGETAVSYTGSGTPDEACAECDFSAVLTRTDCAANDQICQEGVCIDEEPSDRCDGVVCDMPVDRCEDNISVQYMGDGVCDPVTGACGFEDVETRVDCTLTDEVCREGACVAEDLPEPCDDVVCAAPDDRCEEGVAVQYNGEGLCEPDTGQCLFDEVETRTDCVALEQVCQEGACVDLCAEETCAPPADACEDGVAVQYIDSGVCDFMTGECGFAEVETRTDCATLDQVCQEGACVDLCDGVDCTSPANSCEGGVATQYSEDGVCVPSTGMCDFSNVRSDTDCASLERVCQEGACVDLCSDELCQAPVNFCEDGVAVQYTDNGVCDFMTGECGFDAVESRTNCADSGRVCQEGGCVDLCSDELCLPPANFCDDSVAVQYADNGVCDFMTGDCSFSEVETRTNCADSAQVCQNGSCVDLCADIGCDAPEAFCDDNVLVDYGGNGSCNAEDGECDFSAVETRTDCVANQQVCREATCVDLCADVDCGQPESFCEVDVSVQYTDAGVCDFMTGVCDFTVVETRTDCGIDAQICQDGVCVDLCADVDCSQPDNSCNGDIATRYTGDGVCGFREGQCDFGDVTTQTDCAAFNNICDNGLCIDLCIDVDCSQPANVCEGQMLVEYSGDGVCDFREGQCDFEEVQQSTDCRRLGQICMDGACVEDVPRGPQPGDLVITEYMKDPAIVLDSNGEWFEIYNTTTETLVLSGMVLTDGNSNTTQVQSEGDILLPGLSYFVLGNNSDGMTNGGVTVNYEYSSFTLGNGADTIRLLTGFEGEVIDEVTYDDGETFPDLRGISAQFGGEFDLRTDDNNVGGVWCASRDRILGPESEFGTPGAANVPCVVPALDVTVFDLSNEEAPEHPADQTRVRVEGLVVTAIGEEQDLFFAQAPEGGNYSGIAIDRGNVDVSGLERGSLITVDGMYAENRGLAVITLNSVEVTGSSALPEVRLASSDTLAVPEAAEPLESMLVRVQKVIVTDANPDGDRDFNEFTVSTQRFQRGPLPTYVGLASSLRVDDYFHLITPDPMENDLFVSVQGVLNYSFSNFKILPRDAEDVELADTTIVDYRGEQSFTPTSATLGVGHAVLFRNLSEVDLVRLMIGNEVLVLNLASSDVFYHFFDDSGVFAVSVGEPSVLMQVTVE